MIIHGRDRIDCYCLIRRGCQVSESLKDGRQEFNNIFEWQESLFKIILCNLVNLVEWDFFSMRFQRYNIEFISICGLHLSLGLSLTGLFASRAALFYISRFTEGCSKFKGKDQCPWWFSSCSWSFIFMKQLEMGPEWSQDNGKYEASIFAYIFSCGCSSDTRTRYCSNTENRDTIHVKWKRKSDDRCNAVKRLNVGRARSRDTFINAHTNKKNTLYNFAVFPYLYV